MARYENFEDLPIWQAARTLAKAIYELTQSGEFRSDRGLSDQLRRAIVSSVSNIAEGFERASDKDFAHFLTIAKASVGEVRAQLYVAMDIKYLDETDHQRLNLELKDLAKQIGGFIQYLKQDRETPRHRPGQ